MKHIKPDLSSGRGGWVDPEFIPEQVRGELLLHLNKSSLTEAQQVALIAFANDIGQMVVDGDIEAGKTQREQIEAVASNARRLLASIKMLGEPARDALHAHCDYLAFGSEPPLELDRHIKAKLTLPGTSLLSESWDWVAALETASIYTTEKFNIDKTSKPAQMRARGFVSMMSDRVFELTGSKPPKDPASWFASFAECLGRHLNLEIGPRIIKSGIEATR